MAEVREPPAESECWEALAGETAMELGCVVRCHWQAADAEACARLWRPAFPQGVFQPHAMRLPAWAGQPDQQRLRQLMAFPLGAFQPEVSW